MGAPDILFRLTGVTRVYGEGRTEVRALRGVDLDVPRGEFIVLLGPSGSGKSTLLNIIGGLDRPSAGAVHFRGEDMARLSDQEMTEYRRRHIGFVFQFYNLVPSLTAAENVQLVTDISAAPLPAIEALGLVNLAERADAFPSQLSGGEQQRVAIARAIAKRPDVMLCDEPTGALDSATGILVLKALLDANATLATTMLIVTHNAAIAELGHRVLRFRDGMIVENRANPVRKAPGEIAW
ncbi:MAG: ABC transporter ATP-binding protein [Sandarakinorhabdus sp.]|nr:ABC transporter ATP-binding protein [Sandarakinorhabdus sp.]